MSSQPISSTSTDDLKQRYNQLRADRACLASQLASLRSIPNTPSEPSSSLDVTNDELGRQLRSLEEKAILYRSAAWTCFEIDLDVGRRARSMRDANSAEKDGDLGLGIRLDTFWRGRFYEPYYLVFARPSQMLDSMPSLEATTVGDVQANSLADELRLIRHTIPHFVPLEKLAERYLPSVSGEEASGGTAGRGRDNEAGGLTMLSQFQELPGVHAFLSDLHCHLQAYVSRRQQAMALQQVKLPGSSGDKQEPALEALGTEAFDLVKVTWRIPSSKADEARENEENDDAESNPTAAAVKAVAKRKRDQPDDEPITHLELVVHYDDLQSDRLVDETRPSSFFSPTTLSEEETVVEGQVEGTRKPYGTVRVQLLEYAPELEVRQRRAPGISKADIKALRPQVTRREDLEQMYVQQVDGEAMDMDEAFQRIAERVWRQQTKGANCEQVEQLNWRYHLRRLLRIKIDPRLYRASQSNFRELAALYPSTFGKFVKDDGGYEAKVDFRDPEAVRCLAQTLLRHDFGIDASLSPENLCPMIPNRVAYVAFIYELLQFTLPTRELLQHFSRRGEGHSKVVGLDVGTGASAIYAILAAACFPSWRMVGTDIDEASLNYAKENIVDRSTLSDRIDLRHVDKTDSFIPSGLEEEVTFTMCNPPFYSSFSDMQRSAEFKSQAPSAVCQGNASEMVTAGGEVEFVRNMIRESTTSAKGRMAWWTCMLGKLSSIVTLAEELKGLASEGRVGGWGVSELKTGGGKTRRWVLIWTCTPLRLSDRLSRDGLPPSLDKVRPPTGERCGKVLRLGPGWTRREVSEVVRAILDGMDGCKVFSSRGSDLQVLSAPRRSDGSTQKVQHNRHMVVEDVGALDMVLTEEGWNRRARRAKLRQEPLPDSQGSSSIRGTDQETLLMARISIIESNAVPKQDRETGLRVNVVWTYGMDAIKFESFAGFLISAVERRIQLATTTTTTSAP